MGRRRSSDPVGQYEIWVDNTVDPAVLQFKNEIGQWTELDTGNEVTVGSTDPYVTNPGSVDEMWYDTGKGVPGTLYVRVGSGGSARWQEIAPLGTSVSTAPLTVRTTGGHAQHLRPRGPRPRHAAGGSRRGRHLAGR